MNKRRGEGIDRKGGLTKKFDSKKCNSSAFRIQIIRGLSRILRVFARNLPLSLSLSLSVCFSYFGRSIKLSRSDSPVAVICNENRDAFRPSYYAILAQ